MKDKKQLLKYHLLKWKNNYKNLNKINKNKYNNKNLYKKINKNSKNKNILRKYIIHNWNKDLKNFSDIYNKNKPHINLIKDNFFTKKENNEDMDGIPDLSYIRNKLHVSVVKRIEITEDDYYDNGYKLNDRRLNK